MGNHYRVLGDLTVTDGAGNRHHVSGRQGELHRVLERGGRLLFVEHVRSGGPSVGSPTTNRRPAVEVVLRRL